ncbi:hypothetical protein PO878_00600 [Iamia majanohamensis]|uniref:NfeD-like C-terminal domain-containing protein n=1 Tax=Iamia majanohamensis TaxID=467976 RepID=A0AAE9Y5L8_9ACTN|nr:hypothetical protein [Iamia majanohamensis]WCO67220.1 hypothetical protein PO878_00600 [Iamia majanohamensis]
MNAFLWVGLGCTAVLLVALVLDGLDDAFDALDLGPSWLSLPVLAAFGGAFGWVTGALVGALGPVAVVIGLVAGLVFGAATVRFSAFFSDMPTDHTETEADMLGSLGRVVEAPQAGRYGAALLSRPSGPVKVACTSEVTLAVGTPVVVVDVTSSTLVAVEPFDADAALGP